MGNLSKTIEYLAKAIENLPKTIGNLGKTIEYLAKAVGSIAKTIENLIENHRKPS